MAGARQAPASVPAVTWAHGARPITIAILALGGEGGGVLSDWIVALAEGHGYAAQNTSVAGVAQRTGATIYYIELLPPAPEGPPAGGRPEPVLSLFPTPGEVDVVIASELMEAGRSIQRGFCTPDRTVLIASTSRTYTIDERIALGDGRVDDDELLAAAQAGAQRLVAADFARLATEAQSVISASLFGALAASAALPFDRADFERTITASGKGVEASLDAFAAGYDAALRAPHEPAPAIEPAAAAAVPVTIGPRPEPDAEQLAAALAEQERDELARTDPVRLVGPELRAQAARVGAEFPAAARSMLLRGCERTAVYQGLAYTDRYLDRVARIAGIDPDAHGAARLTVEAARHVALWMCYQDTIHVAHQKIRGARMARVRDEVRVGGDQLMTVHDYLHPRSEELTDTLPRWLGAPLARSKTFRRWVDRAAGDGMVVNTTSVLGYTMLWTMARCRPLRPRSLRFHREQHAIDSWLAAAAEADDPDLAREIIECQRVLKGYGETHAHGVESFTALLAAAVELRGRDDAAAVLADLRAAALADEDGAQLREALASTVRR